jgi:WD40 repeat protein
MEDLAVRQLKGYTLLERVGAGGFGAVYRAEQPLVGREVAIKIILPQYANHPDFIRRFEVEARVIARLEHPHIIPLYDYWRDPDGAYLVMRYLRGGSLRSLLADRRMTLPEASRILDQLAGALAVAHRHDVVHRDIKPDNILFDEDGNAYLTDFGIAKDLRDDTKVTQADMVIGSPAYLSPEQIRTEDVTPRSDIYALGVLLYEMLTGQHPFEDAKTTSLLLKHLSDPLPPLSDLLDDIPDSVEKVIQRATAKDPAQRYSDVPTLAAAFRQAILLEDGSAAHLLTGMGLAGEALDHTLLLEELDVDNPYKGLEAFEEADSANFFGREALIDHLLTRLRDQQPGEHFLAIIGPSGSGKSSVVKAGIIPRMRHGTLPGSSNWFVVEMEPGLHPLEELETTLLRIAVNPPPSLLAQLKEDTRGLLRAARRCLPDDRSELFLFIDQFEQVFTQARDKDEVAHFLDSIVTAVTDESSRVRVIITLRADFYDRPLLYPAFGDLVRRFTEVVLPMTPDELERAIVGPSQRVGVMLEPGLANRIVAEVHQQPGALPLLQYALTELFERREGRLLTTRAYEAIGGALVALARRADEVFRDLSLTHQELARQMFLRMVALGEGGMEDTRRRVPQSEMLSISGDSAAMNAVIDAFDHSRLLTFDRDPISRERTIEVAHEALIREWARLQNWLAESREDLLMHRRLQTAASEWARAGKDPSYLATGARLQQFESGRLQSHLAFSAEEAAYLQASIDRREQEAAREAERQAREDALEQRSRQRLRALVAVMTIAAAISLALAAFAFNARQEAVTSAELAATSQFVAEANAASAATAQANAEANRIQAEANAAEAIANANAAATAQANAEANRIQAEANAAQALANADAAATAQAVAEANRVEAVRSAAEARGLALAANARNLLAENDPVLALALAIEAHNIYQPAPAEVQQTLARAAYGPNARYKLEGHRGSVLGVDSGGGRAASVAADGTLIVWDLQRGTILAQRRLDVPAHSVDLSADGRRVLTGLFNGDVVLWNADSGAEIQRFSGHTDVVTRAVFSPDETRIFSGSLDRTLRLWNVQTGAQISVFETPGAILNVAFSASGTLGVSSSADETAADDPNDTVDRTIRVWNLELGLPLMQFEPGSGFVRAVDFSPDGRYVASGTWNSTDGGVVQLWSLSSGRLERRFFGGHRDVITQVKFNSDGTRLLSASWDRALVVWDVQTGVEQMRLASHDDRILSVAFGPTEDYVLVGTGNIGNNIPDPARDAVRDPAVWVWDLARSRAQMQVMADAEDWLWGVAVSPDGRYIAGTTGPFRPPQGRQADTSVYLWDSRTGETMRHFVGHTDTVTAVRFMPDGEHILSSSWDGTVRLWGVDGGEPERVVFRHDQRVHSIDISPDGARAISASADRTIRLWDIASGRERVRFVGHTGDVNSAAFSPDGRFIASASSDMSVRLWDALSGEEIRRFNGHTSSVAGVVFSPDGRLLLTTSWDSTARLWNVNTGQEVRQLIGHNGAVFGPSFSPDGRYALTGSADTTARLWDVSSGDEIRRFEGHTNWVQSTAFAPDGTFIVTGAEDNTVRQWVMARSTSELITWARRNRYIPALTCPVRAQYRVEPLC